jgi:WD40 repeat protein
MIYLWVAATGARKATLQGHIIGGLNAAFHPAGSLLASNGWERRLWLWDAVIGRPWLKLDADWWSACEFSQDGRVVVSLEDEMVTYRVDPALEYRAFAHASSQRFEYGSPSIRHDGRILAVGTEVGVVLWDLARGVELALLPTGWTFYPRFEPSGDLLTSGAAGVLRWPVQLDSDRGVFRIGPPCPLPLPAGTQQMATDLSGRIVALAEFDRAFVQTPERVFSVGPLDDCRNVAVSPDGQWLVTGSFGKNGFQVWHIADATKVAQVAVEGLIRPSFSPDGRWLMANHRLWEVGTWRDARQKIGGEGLCFSTDGRQVVVQDSSRVIRLVETETGRALARLESPDLCAVHSVATFSPDGSRLVVTTNDGPAIHVWDLRAIRRRLALMGLDWDAPAYSDNDADRFAPPPPPPLKVGYGPSTLTGHIDPKVYEPLISDLESALARHPDQRLIRGMLSQYCNNFAWWLATAPESRRDSQRALSLARRAVELAPKAAIYLNTLGVAQYRAGQLTEAIATLEKSRSAGNGESDAFDLFFLAMAHHRLGDADQARVCFDRAVQWWGERKNLPAQYIVELTSFRAEAESVLALTGPGTGLPADVFAPE